MKKTVFLFLLLALAFATDASGKKYPFNINVTSTVTVTRSSSSGFKLVEVIATSSNVDKAMDKALVDAAVAVAFYGCSGTSTVEAIPAILTEGAGAYQPNRKYFDQFFGDGEFLSYVQRVTTGYPSGNDNVNIGGNRRIRLDLKVDFEGMNKAFKAQGLSTVTTQLTTDITAEGKGGKVINAQKPKVMVVPEEAFCINSGFVKQSNGNTMADYVAAMRDDNVLNTINTFGNLMAERGFPLTDLQAELDKLKEEAAMDNVLQAKDDGMVMEDDLDRLSRTAQADIIVKIAPKISPYGPERLLEMRVSTIDCASKKQLEGFGPVTKHSSGTTALLVKAAVTDNIEKFCAGLSNYFDDLQEKGREGNIIIKVADTCPLNLESEVTYEGETGELGDLITMWMGEHAVGGAFTGGKTSRVSMRLDQVRFPLFGKAGFGGTKALTMEDFVKTGLVKLLSQYGISVSTHAVGIGQVYMTLGGM